MDNLDPFQIRSHAFLLDLHRNKPDVTRDMFNVLEVSDISLDVWNQLHVGIMGLTMNDGHSMATKAIRYKALTSNAFWMHYLANEDYSGEARCLVNPPPKLKLDLEKSVDVVTIRTERECGCYGAVLDTSSMVSSGPDGLYLHERLLKLSSIRGEEKGFFNEVVVFCNGLASRMSVIIADWLAKHILPQTTCFIFEVPNQKAGLWTTLFEPLPETDVSAIIEEVGKKTGLFFHQIKVQESGPRTTLYFGIDTQEHVVDKPA